MADRRDRLGVDSEPIWELRGVSKAFPGVQALDQVSLTLRLGEVHALVGENGSGKSTLVKCLAGVHEPDGGDLIHQGDFVRLRDPLAARDHGVATFHQEFSLVPSLSVAENVCLGRLPARGPMIDWNAARDEARRAFAELEVNVDPDAPVGVLSVADQQFVELAKAISQEMSLLILDEPTAALGPAEVERLHRIIARTARQGRAILYISHRLDEVLSVADRVTVLKDGRLVATRDVAEVTIDDVIRLMVGADLDEHFPDRVAPGGPARVEVRDLWSDGGARGASFEIARGEILGLAGIAGSGRTAIARALFGADRVHSGELRIDDQVVRARTPRAAIAAGIGLIPEDRKAHGLFFNLAGPENITIIDLAQLLRGPVLRLSEERTRSRQLVEKLRIAGNVMDGSVQYLSGGNQQKVVLARWLFAKARLLILDEPTQGVDVSSKLEIYHLINELSGAGLALVLISSDFAELLAMSDRIAVVRDGRIVHTAPRGSLSEHDLVEMAAGGNAA
ncbi:MAG TPA: sugar ABC transporter ATP-binding protein [Egibacteraceae bacterium]|nr:sugar ABC transporter ATP-binding protein [Egibacteraceae bacterium]